ncbi:D-amino-acid transaminase [Hyphococcus flavus]|uniref:Probable branched-chain-amino-acid aminotransferase n=1 Tax=Hyphococcus flavus TaxID=1866326 RepID=A0AAF0CBE8_9PROT|nr:D-amino-acid transaminase [Hyphococcus flavus]WDI30790.1 D-amino-acid transaminase [Hyphococcus flavus]
MSRVAYVNGSFTPHLNAHVHIEDRGYQFADGVYEVCIVIDGRTYDFDGHYRRLERSLNELRMPAPMKRAPLEAVIRELLRRNRLRDALVYIQVTRGVAPRNHPFPPNGAEPVMVMTARRFNVSESDAKAAKGVKVISQPDIRWGRVDIKTVGLLPNVLAKQAAVEAGAAETFLVRDGVVTECSSSNAWIVDKSGVLITHPKGNHILGGITRETAIACAQELQLKVEERAFTLEEAKAATEAFMTSATSFVMPIVAIDDSRIGDGQPGPIAARLRNAYKNKACGN